MPRNQDCAPFTGPRFERHSSSAQRTSRALPGHTTTPVLPRAPTRRIAPADLAPDRTVLPCPSRSEEHTSELQSRLHLVCRLLLEKKKKLCRTQRLGARARTQVIRIGFNLPQTSSGRAFAYSMSPAFRRSRLRLCALSRSISACVY